MATASRMLAQAGGRAAAVASKARSASGRARSWARPTPTLEFEELTDPQGIVFWPEPIGRDNTRTPMVWDGSAQGGLHHRQALAAGEAAATGAQRRPAQAGRAGVGAGTATARCWPSAKATPALRDGRHAVSRPARAGAGLCARRRRGALLCLFNLSPVALSLTVSGVGAPGRAVAGCGPAGRPADAGPERAAFLPVDRDSDACQ